MTDQVLQLREWTLEQALAYDGGPPPRVATTAHPDCRCGKPYLPTCRWCGAKPGRPCKPVQLGDVETVGCDPDRERMGRPAECPQHRPVPRRRR